MSISDATRYLYTFLATCAGATGKALILVPASSSEEEMIGSVFAALGRQVATVCILEAELCGIYKGTRRLEGLEEAEVLRASCDESKRSPTLPSPIGKLELTYYFGSELNADARWTAFRDGFAMCGKKHAEFGKKHGGPHAKGG